MLGALGEILGFCLPVFIHPWISFEQEMHLTGLRVRNAFFKLLRSRLFHAASDHLCFS